MNNSFDRNPFEVLRLDPTASNEQVVQQAAWLRRRGADEGEWARIRQAARSLTGEEADRFFYEMLTHPAPQYQWAMLDQLQAALRRPAHFPQEPESFPLPELAETTDLLRPILAEACEIAGAKTHSPAPSGEEEGKEIGNLWQKLLENGLA